MLSLIEDNSLNQLPYSAHAVQNHSLSKEKMLLLNFYVIYTKGGGEQKQKVAYTLSCVSLLELFNHDVIDY